MAKDASKKLKDVREDDVLYIIRKDALEKGIRRITVSGIGVESKNEKYIKLDDVVGWHHIPKESLQKKFFANHDSYIATSRNELLKAIEIPLKRVIRDTQHNLDVLSTMMHNIERIKTKRSDVIRKFPTPLNFNELESGVKDVQPKCDGCGYNDVCDHIRCTGFVTLEYLNKKAQTAAGIISEQAMAREKKYERTFVPKSHNAVKISEHMARRMFADGVRIIVRPSGRNTLERGAVYKRGESLVWKDKKTAHTFEDIINDFKIGFGRSDGNDTFRFYLYMD